MSLNEYELSNGLSLPALCYGTDIVSEAISDNEFKRLHYWLSCKKHHNIHKYKKDKGILQCVKQANKMGVRFFDTSRAYGGSEKMLSTALKMIPRNQYYICTKLCNRHQLNGVPAREALQNSLEQLGTSYVDVYLLHWPVEGKFLDYWKQLEELYDEGLCKAIGVSNCKIHHLDEILNVSRISPMVDEIECHPLLSETNLRSYCITNNIQVMAYTSTARLDFRLRNSRRMQSVCEKYNKNLSQVILRWHFQNKVIPVFNTSSINHLEENILIDDFELSNEDMEIINSMNINARTRYDSDNCEWDRL